MQADLTREQRIHLALWRKAYREGGLTANLPDIPTVVSLRMAMYRTIKPYRENEFLDRELYSASLELVIANAKDEPVLRLIPRKSLAASNTVMSDLGLTEDDLLSPDEFNITNRMSDELNKLAVRVEPSQEPPEQLPETSRSTPFYTRD